MEASTRSRVHILFAALLLAATLRADEWVLSIPREVSAATPLHIAAPVPEGVLAPGQAGALPLMVEDGVQAKGIPYDLIATTREDGSPDAKRLRLLATIPARPDAKGDRVFKFLPAPRTRPRVQPKRFAFKDVSPKSIAMHEALAPGQTLPVLAYNHGMISKQGVAARYNRACYIHPLYGVDGETITEDFATDHRHHRGVWWSWPHIKIDGKQYNSWIPSGFRYQHERWVLKRDGAAAGVLAAENSWVVTGDQKVVREFVWIIAYPAAGGIRVVDVELTWTPLEKPVTLQGAGGKSYGGLTFRFAQAKDQPRAGRRKDTRITIDTGLTKKDLPNTRLTWADITGHAVGAKARSGCAILIPKDHPDYPPTWLTRHYGPLCVGWPGVKPMTLPPGKSFRLRYRLWIHRGDADLKTLKAAYAANTTLDNIRWLDARH